MFITLHVQSLTSISFRRPECRTEIPLGLPVDPLVYKIAATEFASAAMATTADGLGFTWDTLITSAEGTCKK